MTTQLRLGNLVTDEFYDSFKKVIVVESINDKGINLSIEHSDDYPEMQNHWIEPYYELEKLRGIPLSEDWLIKFGFELNQEPKFRYINGNVGFFRKPAKKCLWIDYQLDVCKVGDKWEWSYGMPIQYVHQLQNLYFALTGSELTIKEEQK